MDSRASMTRLALGSALIVGIFAATVGLVSFGGPSLALAQADTTGPTISSVAITSDPDEDDSIYADWYDDGVYGIDDEVEVTVTFSENVTVTGSPQLEITIGTNAKDAGYKSTTDSKVVFRYTVASGNNDTDGIAISADKLTLNGGSIKDAAENPADLAHSALSAQTGHKVDGIRPTITTAPYLVDSSIGTGGVYIIGEKLSARVGFSEEVIAIGAQPVPRLGIDVGGATRYADFSPIPADDWRDVTLIFTYTVVKGDLDLDGVAVAANSLGLNGGTIRDAAGNDAVLTHSAVAADDEFIVDGVPPTVSSIAITSDPGDDDTYDSGDSIEVTVTLSEDVGYRGTPTLNLDIGEATKSAELVRENPGVYTGVMVFRYVVKNGDNDANGISIKANSLTTDRFIRDTTGNLDIYGNDADLTHDAVADDVGQKVATTGEPPQSTDATLSGLTLGGIVLVPTDDSYYPDIFRSSLVSYVASVAYSLTQTTATPTVNHSGASYVIKLGGVEDVDGVLSLAVGSNVITIEVTAEDGETTKTYTVTVTRAAAPSTDATLKWLALSGIDIGGGPGDGAYAQIRTSFTASVYHSVSQTTVTPTPNHSAASHVIKLGGVTDADGVVALSVGSNVITVEVTAEDGQTTKTYTATVTRATQSAPTTGELPTDDPSVNFRAPIYTHDFVALAFNTPRNRGITGDVVQRYEHDGDNFVSAGDDGRFVATFDDDLGGSSTAWSYTEAEPGTLYKWVVKLVNSQNATVIETSLTVRTPLEPGSTALSSDATLRDLMISGLNFEATDRAFIAPGFHRTVTSYVARAANSVTETTVTPIVNHSGASYVIKLGGVTDADGTVSLAVGSNVITIEVTAEDGETTRTYTLTVTRVSSNASTDATLRRLALSGIDFGTFAPGTTSYTAQVANSVTETTVSDFVSHIGARSVVKLGGVTHYARVPLAVGSNIITVEVTAEDLVTTKTYTVTVTRAASPSTDATLKALTLSGLDFGTFAPGTTSYTAEVDNSVLETTVTPTVNHSEASYVIKLGGVIRGLNRVAARVPLTVGTNVITVEVTAEDDSTTLTYTVTVTRTAASTDATLSALTLSSVDFGTFASGTISYSAQVANSVTETTVTPTVNDTGASYVIKLGGVTDADGDISLAVGSNVITIEVTAEDDSTARTYTITVTRAAPPSSDATLKGLTLSGVDFGTFDSTTTSYTGQVANGVSQTTVTPAVNHSGASYVIKLGGVTDADGVVLLSVGSNVITVEVTAEDDSTTRTYTVTVTRAEPPTPGLSRDATLSALALSGVDFGTFDSTTTSYTGQVANGVSQTTVTPAVNHSGASYVIKLGGVTDADGVVVLSVGSNVITIEVTAENGDGSRVYTVEVTRSEPAPPGTSEQGLEDRYDTNNNGTMEKNEVIEAINDYLFGEGDEAISKAEVIKLINLYLFG